MCALPPGEGFKLQISGSGLSVYGLGFRVQGLYQVKVEPLHFRRQGVGFRMLGSGFRV